MNATDTDRLLGKLLAGVDKDHKERVQPRVPFGAPPTKAEPQFEAAVAELARTAATAQNTSTTKPDRVQATRDAACRAVLQVCEETCQEIDGRIKGMEDKVTHVRAVVEERIAHIHTQAEDFKALLRTAAADTVERISEVLSEHANITAFMQDRLAKFIPASSKEEKPVPEKVKAVEEPVGEVSTTVPAPEPQPSDDH